MPSTRIETRAGWLGDRHQELIAAVQAALIEGIRIPEDDVSIRILEYPEGSFAVHPGASAQACVVEISMFAGRSVEAKRRLYSALARAFESFGVPSRDLMIVVNDLPRENWSTRGVALSDVDLDFKVEV